MSDSIPGAEIAPPIPILGARVSTSVGGAVRMPTVTFNRPKVAGEVIIDRGDEAEFEVLHARVGDHIQGSRVTRADFPDGTDFDRLIRLDAVAVLKPVGPAVIEFDETKVKGKGEVARKLSNRPPRGWAAESAGGDRQCRSVSRTLRPRSSTESRTSSLMWACPR
jgi:hypothetical protein